MTIVSKPVARVAVHTYSLPSVREIRPTGLRAAGAAAW
jgi:hypothetical protein